YLTNFNVNSMNEIIPQLFYKIIKMNFMYYRLHLSKEKSRHFLPLTRCSISFIQVKQSGIESCSKQETYIVLLKMNAKKKIGRASCREGGEEDGEGVGGVNIQMGQGVRCEGRRVERDQ